MRTSRWSSAISPSLTVEANAPSLTDDDVLALLEEERRGRVRGRAPRRRADPGPADAVANPPPAGRPRRRALGYAGIVDAPFSTIEVRVVPENVTNLAKTEQSGSSRWSRSATSSCKRARPSRRSCAAYGATPEQIRRHHTRSGGADEGRGVCPKASACGS